MGHKKNKKGTTTPKTRKLDNSNQEANKNVVADNVNTNEQAAIAKSPIKTDISKRDAQKNAAHKVDKNSVSRNTLYFSIVFALIFGVYLGTLLPGFFGETQIVHNVQTQVEISPESGKKILELEQVVLKTPKNTAAWINLGNLYFDAHKHEESIHAYEKALELKPDNVNVLTDLGIMYRSIEKYEKALASFAKANEVDPKHENSLFNSGIVLYFDLNRQEEGRDKWRALLKVNPNSKAPDGKSIRELIKGNF